MVLVEKSRIKVNIGIEEWIPRALSEFPTIEAPLTAAVILAMSKIQLPHRDPADAFLVATAKVFQLTLVTADVRLGTPKGISFLQAHLRGCLGQLALLLASTKAPRFRAKRSRWMAASLCRAHTMIFSRNPRLAGKAQVGARDRQSPDWRIARRHSGEWRSRAKKTK
jgi:hypothetical protein